MDYWYRTLPACLLGLPRSNWRRHVHWKGRGGRLCLKRRALYAEVCQQRLTPLGVAWGRAPAAWDPWTSALVSCGQLPLYLLTVHGSESVASIASLCSHLWTFGLLIAFFHCHFKYCSCFQSAISHKAASLCPPFGDESMRAKGISYIL